MGSISDKVSFRMFPVIYEDGATSRGHGWIRYNQAFGTDWVNTKWGKASSMSRSTRARVQHGNARFAVLYAYTVPGSVSRFNVLFPQPGVEIMGHDRGSRNRYMVNVFDADGAPRAHLHVLRPRGVRRVTHRHDLASGFLRRVQVGLRAYSTWPVGPDTSDLKGQRRFGGDLELWLGSDVLPFRVTVMGLTGRDDRALVPTATQDPKYNAALLQLEYVPKLPLVFYSRLQIIRNQRQAVAGRPDDYGDQDFQLVGVRHALELNLPLRVVAGAHVLAPDHQAGCTGHERDASTTVDRESSPLLNGERMSARRPTAIVAAHIVGALALGASPVSHKQRRCGPGPRGVRALLHPVPRSARRRRGRVARWSQPKPRDFPRVSTSSARPVRLLPPQPTSTA